MSAVAALSVVAGLYWFQPWRLVTDREVRDALPPPAAVAATGPPATPGAAAPGTTRRPAAAPTTGTARDPEAVEHVAAGMFVSHEHDTRGSAELVRGADGGHRLLLRGLATSDGPDLRVWLTDRAVLAGRDGWRVFDDGRWVELDRLKGNRGDQVYDIADKVDIAGLRSVTIWCKRFAVSFGAAPLDPR